MNPFQAFGDAVKVVLAQGHQIDETKVSFVVEQRGALYFMKHVIMNPHRVNADIRLTPDDDELFRWSNIPVRLRVKAPSDGIMIMENVDIDKVSCCDITAYQTVAIALHQGIA